VNDEEEKKAVVFAAQFLSDFNFMKDLRDNTWPAIIHAQNSKQAAADLALAKAEGISVSALHKREEKAKSRRAMISALVDDPHTEEWWRGLPEDALDRGTYFGLVESLAGALHSGGKLSRLEAHFVADVLKDRGMGKRPKRKPGPDKLKSWPRDYTLWRCAQEVAGAYGLMLYSNYNAEKTTDNDEKTTAAQIVSDASYELDKKYL
jgi:hypothetical protein